MTATVAVDEATLIAKVQAVLDTVFDPEIPVVTIAELGILRGVRLVEDATLEILITPTYSGCPAMGQIADDITLAMRAAQLDHPWRIVTQLKPAWTTDWMSGAAKQKLRDYGIAPPAHVVNAASAYGNVVQFAPKNVAINDQNTPTCGQKSPKNSIKCPQCGSENTTEISHFASTACKALYKCFDCREPFDYFKPF